ncbi:phage tail-collar fiber domain-containing protein [Leptotrichia massiliensis]|uniref:phage tail-collar fiber domain-containing protein n=1 Tax=Leptotrichia massiliensis TaxID=1852388 RepID=UPI0008DB0948|nr:phage tail protein [Leptotrichia massiliensis]
MANYIGWEITNKGRELIARAVNNETKINVTKFKIGAGYNTGNDRELTDLIDKRNEFPINSYERKANGNVEFTFVVSNKTGSGASVIANSYKISEMGIYAQDDSGTEILYAYNKGTDGDYIPVYNGKNAIDIIEKCIIVIDQAATINVTIDNSLTYLTRESADRKYLEIQALAKIIGLEFGGNIQDTGNKVKGKFYFDSVTKFYYECIADTNLTYNESSKFRAISNKPLSDKVENLSKVQQAKLYVHSEATGQGRTTCNIVQKVGNVVTIIFDSGDTLRYTNDNTVIFSIPEGYRPKSFLSVNASQFNGTAGTIYIQPDGTAKWRGSTVSTASIIFSVSYII